MYKSCQNVCRSHKTRQNNVICHERRQWAFSDFTSDHIKKIWNKSNAILAACLHLLATFGLECRAFACIKNNTIFKKVGGGGGASAPLPLPVCRLRGILLRELAVKQFDYITDVMFLFFNKSSLLVILVIKTLANLSAFYHVYN